MTSPDTTPGDAETPRLRNRGASVWLWLAALVAAADQGTKWLASTYLEFGRPFPVMPMFNLSLTHNTRAAFSLLHDAGGWQKWFQYEIHEIETILPNPRTTEIHPSGHERSLIADANRKRLGWIRDGQELDVRVTEAGISQGRQKFRKQCFVGSEVAAFGLSDGIPARIV